ncbi:MAG: CYTH domain-containing protein [Gemmatimonadetes bacterium]|nr:CYTH domain-containing protein [Gemmatimonadota bacterium]
MREVELKGVVADPAALRARLLAAGAREVYRGSLLDARYDLPSRDLLAKDHVLRLRVYEDDAGRRAMLDWKGPTSYDTGYKVREEISTPCGDGLAMAEILARMGYVVIREIDREIEQFEVQGTTCRVERYPRMDVLLEIEGEPEAIEAVITLVGMTRAEFTSERLPEFVLRYEARTGERAALCRRELTGDYRYSTFDA